MIFSAPCVCDRVRDQVTVLRDARAGRFDPSGTNKIRLAYERELVRRFRRVRRLIREAIVSLDVLGLKADPTLTKMVGTSMFTRLYAPEKNYASDAQAQKMAPAQFAYSRSSDKVQGFMNWLKQASRAEILDVLPGATMNAAAESAWANVYIDTAYQKGIRDAYSYAGIRPPGGSVSAAFNQPIHADRVGLVYTRNFNELDGVTDAMAQSISRVLAQGMAEGRGARELAADLEDRVDAIGITRARTIARSEIISAHAEGSLNSYKEAGLEGVTVMAEFATAGDDKVCEDCSDLEGKEFSIEGARGIIPVHPNCRCAFLPVVQDDTQESE